MPRTRPAQKWVSTSLKLRLVDLTDYGKSAHAKKYRVVPKDLTKVRYSLDARDAVVVQGMLLRRLLCSLGGGWDTSGYQWAFFGSDQTLVAEGPFSVLGQGGLDLGLAHTLLRPNTRLSFEVTVDPRWNAKDHLSPLPVESPWFGLVLSGERQVDVF